MASNKRRAAAKPRTEAFVPHVGWLWHEPGEEVVSLLRQGYFEAAEQAFIRLFLRPGDTFLDCGAHIGLYSVAAAQTTEGRAHIIAVEASSRTADYLELNLRHNGFARAEVIRAALWNAPGELRFIESGEGKSAYSHVAFDEAVSGESVKAITLDQVVARAPGPVALAKIDVEGAEPEVLDGGSQSIGGARLPVLMIEFTEHNLTRRGSSTEELARKVVQAGYTLCRFSQETFELEPFEPSGPIWFLNLFAVTDLEAANLRLRTAPEANVRIARDIVDRGRACNRFKELEELDRYRTLAGEVEMVRQWAEEADARAETARQEAQSTREWAEEADIRAETARQEAQATREWAERSDQLLAAEKEKSKRLENWAAEAESRASDARSLAEENRAWAQRSDALLAATNNQATEARKLAEERLVWAQRSDAALAAEKAALEQARSEVGNLREQLAQMEDAAKVTRDAAEVTGRLLADNEARIVQLGARADQAEERLQRTQASLAETSRLLEERTARIEVLEREVTPLRAFAARFAWIYRLWRKATDAGN